MHFVDEYRQRAAVAELLPVPGQEVVVEDIHEHRGEPVRPQTVATAMRDIVSIRKPIDGAMLVDTAPDQRMQTGQVDTAHEVTAQIAEPHQRFGRREPQMGKPVHGHRCYCPRPDCDGGRGLLPSTA